MLDNHRNAIIDTYNELFFKSGMITAMRLKSILTFQNPQIKKRLQLFDDFNADYKKSVDKETSHKTYTRYLLTRHRLAEYMESKYGIKDLL